MDITPKEYNDFQSILRNSCGIEVGENKKYLVESRLTGVLQEFKLESFAILLQKIKAPSAVSRTLMSAVIDAMTTNETFWFRDDSQFLALQSEVLPELFLKTRGGVKIWSAACSSGQEPYTISICIEEMARAKSGLNNVQIVGTDISETVLKSARSATYSDMAIKRGMNSHLCARYFHPVDGGFQLKPEVMRRVRFQHLNLLQSFAAMGSFNVIFCRNVLIYFSDEAKRKILQRLIDALEPGGYLFLSSTESVPSDLVGIEPVRGKRARYFKKIT